MDDVAKQAEFSKRTVYMYFNSKEQLYFEIMIKGYKLLLERVEAELPEVSRGGNALDTLRGFGALLYDFSRRYPEYFAAIVEYETAEADFNKAIASESLQECYALGERMTAHLADTLQRGVVEGALREDLDVDRTTLVLWASVIGVLMTVRKKENYLHNVRQTSADELVGAAFEMLLRAIRV
ncbi:Bacterial regulatory protein, tetR family [compost metagenome]